MYFTTALAALEEKGNRKSRQPMGANIQDPPRNLAKNSSKYYFSNLFPPDRVEERN